MAGPYRSVEMVTLFLDLAVLLHHARVETAATGVGSEGSFMAL